MTEIHNVADCPPEMLRFFEPDALTVPDAALLSLYVAPRPLPDPPDHEQLTALSAPEQLMEGATGGP